MYYVVINYYNPVWRLGPDLELHGFCCPLFKYAGYRRHGRGSGLYCPSWTQICAEEKILPLPVSVFGSLVTQVAFRSPWLESVTLPIFIIICE